MPRAIVVSELRTLTKVVAAFAVVLLALALWGSPAWAQVTSLEKTGPDEVLAGEDFTYAIAVRTATNPATDVEVVDELPSGVDLNGTLPPGCTSDEALNRITVTCDLGEVAANTTETITLEVEAPESTGTITNTAECTDVALAEACADTVETEVLPAADLVITKDDNPEPVDVGDNLAYTLRVTNRGPQEATGVELVDDLPGNVIFIELDEGENNRCNLRPGQVVDCALGDLGPGESTRVRVLVEPEEAGTITNTARVSSNTADPRRGNNVDSVRTTVEADTEPTDEETTDEETTDEETTDEETTDEETTDEETTDEETTAEETTDEETSVVDGQTVIIPDELSDKPLPNTGGPGGIALATGCALLGVGLIVNRIIR
jgi:uncharacterized repeat protein (TIGR01451 family)